MVAIISKKQFHRECLHPKVSNKGFYEHLTRHLDYLGAMLAPGGVDVDCPMTTWYAADPKEAVRTGPPPAVVSATCKYLGVPSLGSLQVELVEVQHNQDSGVRKELRPKTSSSAVGTIRSFRGEVDVASLEDMSLGQVLHLYPDSEALKNYAESLTKLAGFEKLKIQNEITRGSLVPKAFVETFLFSYIEAMHRSLLREVPITLSQKLRDAESREDAEREAIALLSRVLKEATGAVTKAITVAADRFREAQPADEGELTE